MKYLIISAAILGATSCTEAQDSMVTVEPVEETVTAEVQQQDPVVNKVVSKEEFKELMKDEEAQLIDVRTPGEVAGGKIDGSTNIDYNSAEFKTEMAKLDKDKPVLLYCASGGRSGRTAAMLKTMGFKEVYDLEGGYRNWAH